MEEPTAARDIGLFREFGVLPIPGGLDDQPLERIHRMLEAKRISEIIWAKENAIRAAREWNEGPAGKHKQRGYQDFLTADQQELLDFLYNEVTKWQTNQSNMPSKPSIERSVKLMQQLMT